MSSLRWRKSSFTNPETCVEVAEADDGTILVRNSNQVVDDLTT